jgi:hypothetical protein
MNNNPPGNFGNRESLNLENEERKQGTPYAHARYLVWGTLALILLFAFAIRVNYFGKSHHVAEVQYRSALLARSFYFNMTASIPEWRRQANVSSVQNFLTREPSITELLTAIGYKLLGGEDLKIPRLLTSVFWIMGGFFLYKIGRDWVSSEGAIVAAVYYLFIPLGVILSISFQPDSLMIMMFVVSLYAILQYYEKPAWNMLIVAAILSGFAILVKPLVFFAITGAFLGAALYQSKFSRQIINRQLIVFFTVGYLPSALYYGYGIFFTGDLMRQVEWSYLPQLLLTKAYWMDWMQIAIDVVGLTPLLAAVISIPLIRRGVFRASLMGLWGGYILFCLVFTYHIRYAGYYHAQLIPIVALSFTPLASLIASQIRQTSNRWYWSLLYVGAAVLLLFINLRNINQMIWSSSNIESRDVAEEIGEIVGHSQRVVYIASYYGIPLEYYAELTGAYWPRKISDHDATLGRDRSLSVEERLKNLGFVPEYFVITAMTEYDTHHEDLKDYLTKNCRLVTKSDHFLIYNSCDH